MPYFLVKQTRGPAWDPCRGRREQDGWDEHAAFVDGLAASGSVLLAGPLGDLDGLDVALVASAASADAARDLFAADPWHGTVLETTSVEPWTVLGRRRAPRGRLASQALLGGTRNEPRSVRPAGRHPARPR